MFSDEYPQSFHMPGVSLLGQFVTTGETGGGSRGSDSFNLLEPDL